MPHPAPERLSRRQRARAARDRHAEANASRPPGSDLTGGSRLAGVLVVLSVPLVVIAGVVLRGHEELAWGMEHLMPTGGRQALGAAILPALLGLAAVVGELSVARGRRYPAWLSGLMVGTAATSFLVAPPPSRYDDGVLEAVPVFAYCTWGSYLLVVGGCLLVVRLRLKWAASAAGQGRPGPPSIPSKGPGPRRVRLLVRVAVIIAVPVLVVPGLIAVGRERGEPPIVDAVVVAVPGLAGSRFEERASTAELEETAAWAASLLAGELTDDQPLDRGWKVLLRTTTAPGTPADARVFLTVWALSDDADLDAARAQLAAEVEAEGGEPLPEGWLAAFTQSYGAAALDGRFLIVLEAGEDDETVAARTALMRAAAAALTPERRAAVLEATDPESR
ncbi:hypothetical protein [Blastococcus sp. LR1]|uniref:hypothetical protein n=1 Tax=Blastococcus sp. LR1 TaxID=2877000 RepID=UPI001CCF478F|nr:hypothetical protein [Blastococcus sp. LR1]MCA0146568.1 hypothetical protein [Blastococcus sp. LR1]